MRRVQTDFHILPASPDNGFVEVVQPAKRTGKSLRQGRKQYLPLTSVGQLPDGYVSSVYPTGTTQALSGTGALAAIDLGSSLTTVDTTGAATSTMGAGTVTGLMKTIRMIGDLGDMVITVAGDAINSITLNDVNDVCTLQWTGTGWQAIDNVGCVLA